jgi:hypothetical protein
MKTPGPIGGLTVALAIVVAIDLAAVAVRLPGQDAAAARPSTRAPATSTPTPSAKPSPEPLHGVSNGWIRSGGLVHRWYLPGSWERADQTASAAQRETFDRALSHCLHVPDFETSSRSARHHGFDDYGTGFDAIDTSTYVFDHPQDAARFLAATQNGAGVGCVRQVQRAHAQPPAGARVTGVDARLLPMPAALFGTRTTITLRTKGKTFATYDDAVFFVARNELAAIHFYAAGAPPALKLEQHVLEAVLHRLHVISNRVARS